MKLALVRFRLAIEHPALGGGYSASRELFLADGHPELKDGIAFAMDTISDPPGVQLTAGGHTRIVNWAQVIHADPVQPPRSALVQLPGKKR